MSLSISSSSSSINYNSANMPTPPENNQSRTTYNLKYPAGSETSQSIGSNSNSTNNNPPITQSGPYNYLALNNPPEDYRQHVPQPSSGAGHPSQVGSPIATPSYLQQSRYTGPATPYSSDIGSRNPFAFNSHPFNAYNNRMPYPPHNSVNSPQTASHHPSLTSGLVYSHPSPNEMNLLPRNSYPGAHPPINNHQQFYIGNGHNNELVRPSSASSTSSFQTNNSIISETNIHNVRQNASINREGNPRLVRTTTLSHNSDTEPSSPSSINHSLYGTENSRHPKIVVKFQGDINSMTRNWSPRELEVGRRLVKFDWTQTGNTLNIKFQAIRPEDYHSHDAVISCLYWASPSKESGAKTHYFVTSVDVIQLLEKLVNQKFVVEEKNRIRRNLQGLKPITVARSKHAFAEFFTQIMKYPAPRPRNIEKDVKVFNWQSLHEAIQRVLSKYSCDYSEEPRTSSGLNALHIHQSQNLNSYINDVPHSSQVTSNSMLNHRQQPYSPTSMVATPPLTARSSGTGLSLLLQPPVSNEARSHPSPVPSPLMATTDQQAATQSYMSYNNNSTMYHYNATTNTTHPTSSHSFNSPYTPPNSSNSIAKKEQDN